MLKGCVPMTNYIFDPIFCIAWHFHMPQKRRRKREEAKPEMRHWSVGRCASFSFQSHGKFNETDHYRFMWHLIKMFAIGRSVYMYYLFIWTAMVRSLLVFPRSHMQAFFTWSAYTICKQSSVSYNRTQDTRNGFSNDSKLEKWIKKINNRTKSKMRFIIIYVVALASLKFLFR